MTPKYNFPVSNAIEALDVTDARFDINQPDVVETLRVDFTPVRSQRLFQQLKMLLGIDQSTNQLHDQSRSRQIVFSGHRGCGKTTELMRFSREVNKPEQYYCLYIPLESKIDMYKMAPEDLFFIIIATLVRQLHKDKIDFAADLMQIAQDWVSNTELTEEISKEYGYKIEAGGKAEMSFLKLLAAQVNIGAFYGQNNKTTEIIRQDIKTNQGRLVDKLNIALTNIVAKIKKAGKGQNILFIIDGFEKAPQSVYNQLFIENPQLLNNLTIPMIVCVPIQTYYEIKDRNSLDYFTDAYLPMIRLTDESKLLLKEVISKRIKLDFWDKDALEHLIDYSGGCIRQLLRLVNSAILETFGQKINLSVAKQAIQKEGADRWRTLTTNHQEILRQQNFQSSDTEVLELLFSLAIFEYNGNNPERKINPVILAYKPDLRKL